MLSHSKTIRSEQQIAFLAVVAVKFSAAAVPLQPDGFHFCKKISGQSVTQPYYNINNRINVVIM